MEEEVVGIVDLFALGVGERQGRLEPAGDGVGDVGDEFARLDGEYDALTFDGLEAIAIDAAGRDLAVDDGGQRDIGGGLGSRGADLAAPTQLTGCLSSGFRGLGQLVDAELQRVGESVGCREAQFAITGDGGGREGDLHAHRFGDGGRGGAADEASELLADLGDGGLIGWGRRLLLHQFLELVAELGGLSGCERLEVLDDCGLYARAGDDRAIHVIEELSADGDFEARALASAGGIDVAGMRDGLLRDRQGEEGEDEYQRAATVRERYGGSCAGSAP